MIKYLDTPDGYFVTLPGHLGSIEATVHRPYGNHPKQWRLCFASCTGEAYSLQGKVRDFMTLAALKHELNRYDDILNGPGTPIPGFRWLPERSTT